MDGLKILCSQCVRRLRDPSIVRTHRQVQIARSLIKKQHHPNCDETSRCPWIVVIDIQQLHVDEATPLQLPHSFSRKVGRPGKSDIAATVPIDEDAAMIEPRLRHDDRSKRISYKARRKTVPPADIVVAGPIGNHLSVCNRAHRLRNKIPVVRLHHIPLSGVHENVSMSGEHIIQGAVPQWFGNVVPVRKMHAAPEHQIALDVVDSRVPFEMLGGNSDWNSYRRGVHQRSIDIDRKYVWHRSTNLVLQRCVTRCRAADHERQTEGARENPSTPRSRWRGTHGRPSEQPV